MTLYDLQLLFKLAWSRLFFGQGNPLLALVETVVLLALIGVTTLRFAALSRPAAALMLPYLAWVAFATALNGAFW